MGGATGSASKAAAPDRSSASPRSSSLSSISLERRFSSSVDGIFESMCCNAVQCQTEQRGRDTGRLTREKEPSWTLNATNGRGPAVPRAMPLRKIRDSNWLSNTLSWQPHLSHWDWRTGGGRQKTKSQLRPRTNVAPIIGMATRSLVPWSARILPPIRYLRVSAVPPGFDR